METIQDLIEEAKLRALWWALCIFALTYFLSHTSSSMWMNLPISILFVFALRLLFNEVEFKRKPRMFVRPVSYLSHLEKKQMSVNDSRLSSVPPLPRWKRKIDSPIVEAAINEFIDMVLKDFVVDLWYSEITPDKEAPELMRSVIMDALGEISGRVKEINLVDLLTRDIVDLIGDHLELFRRNQASIGVDVMGTLSTEERDDRLKHHLMVSKELHPALISPESEYKFLQRIVGGVIALVLRPREVQCPLVRSIARELVTCLVLQPVMNLMSPVYINQVIESILVAIKVGSREEVGGFQSTGGVSAHNSTCKEPPSLNSAQTDVFDDKKNHEGTGTIAANIGAHGEKVLDHSSYQKDALQPRHTDWARLLEAATQRRTEVLTPENLENMWAKGRNYKKKENKIVKAEAQQPLVKSRETPGTLPVRVLWKESLTVNTVLSAGKDDRAVSLRPRLSADALLSTLGKDGKQFTQDEKLPFEREHANLEPDSTSNLTLNENNTRLKRSNSASALKTLPDNKKVLTGQVGGPIISEFYSADYGRHNEGHTAKNVLDIVIRNEGHYFPKLKCRVMGAYFEKLGSKSFAVYSIAVTDAENRTWFVKRRYSNFERLHRHLKDIPNYTLHLPPKRIFSSSTEDAFVHQRCIQLDKYLQDLLSIANVVEQHEVWDFLSVSSKNYSFGKSSSVMRTLAVNVDDAVDDIVRQVKGVSDGFKRKVVGSSSTLYETSPLDYRGNMSWHADDMNSRIWRQETSDTVNSFSDGEESHNQECHGEEEVGPSQHAYHCHSDNELNTKSSLPRAIKHGEEFRTPVSDEKINIDSKPEWNNQGAFPSTSSSVTANYVEDPVGMPPEWTPPNVSVPMLNLVDKVFQLQRRGWLRRQVFWISKQILQLMMEDAIDDWLLRQIYWLRREETVALGIRWVQDILWPDGTSFFAKVDVSQGKVDDAQPSVVPFQISQFSASKALKGSFEEQLEAARRASDIKKMLFDGAPAALVSLIGNKQYKRCARDIFYFTQSSICVKQLAYSIVELLLLSVFPELRDVLLDIHEMMRIPPA